MMIWDKRTGLRDAHERHLTFSSSKAQPVKQAPPGCGTGNASPTIKSVKNPGQRWIKKERERE